MTVQLLVTANCSQYEINDVVVRRGNYVNVAAHILEILTQSRFRKSSYILSPSLHRFEAETPHCTRDKEAPHDRRGGANLSDAIDHQVYLQGLSLPSKKARNVGDAAGAGDRWRWSVRELYDSYHAQVAHSRQIVKKIKLALAWIDRLDFTRHGNSSFHVEEDPAIPTLL
jgi:hypothetical protein